MKRLIILCAVCTVMILTAFSALGQKRLQITEKDMTGVIYREAGDNETVVEIRSNVHLSFESTMDKEVIPYEVYSESGFTIYKFKFPTGNIYKGRQLTIKSYGFENYDYPLDLQAKVPVGLFVLDPDLKIGVDIITLKTGDDIQSLIQEIGGDEVKYKKVDNPNGPNYTIKKSEILMITYANGSRDVFADTSPSTATPSSTPVTSSTSTSITKQPSTQNSQRHPDELTMVLVRGGTFTMGAPTSDTEAESDERPTHQVILSSFYIGKYEVTQKEWSAMMGSNPSHFKGDYLPVEGVSWDDIVGTSGNSEVINGIRYHEDGFIHKLNEATGKKFRLPTEAEWEYAARGGNQSKGYLYSGSNSVKDVAWYSSNSNGRTHEVGTKSSNELGICDMTGNVWEWCSDWYGSYTSATQSNPAGPSAPLAHVLRGGSWKYSAKSGRISSRDDATSAYHDNNLGFRLACSAEIVSSMTITSTKSEITFHLVGEGEATIDWGDGSHPDTKPITTNQSQHITYNYKEAIPHKITIYGKHITGLMCTGMELTDIDVSRNIALEVLGCYGNSLSTLDITKNAALKSLACGSNRLTNLDVSRNIALENIICNENNLSSLNVTKNTALKSLVCGSNRLTNLDVSKNTALMGLLCESNQLTNLNVSTNTALVFLNCESNYMRGAALNALFKTLHSNPSTTGSKEKIILIRGNGPDRFGTEVRMEDIDRSIATKKGWSFYIKKGNKQLKDI